MKMKIPVYSCFLFVICLFFLLSSCGDISNSDTWTVSGTFTLNSGIPDNPIKLAAFFIGQNDFTSENPGTMVSDVAVMDLEDNESPFSLDIDTSGVTPLNADQVELIVWVDDNDDDLFDTTEAFSEAAPVNGCPVWDPNGFGTFCSFYWFSGPDSITEQMEGWNVQVGLEQYIPIEEAVLTGAQIYNWMALDWK